MFIILDVGNFPVANRESIQIITANIIYEINIIDSKLFIRYSLRNTWLIWIFKERISSNSQLLYKISDRNHQVKIYWIINATFRQAISQLIAPTPWKRWNFKWFRWFSSAHGSTMWIADHPCNCRSVAFNGRGRRPVLAELTVIPRGCRAELSTTGRTSFKETDKSESPSRRRESWPVPERA